MKTVMVIGAVLILGLLCWAFMAGVHDDDG